MKTAKKHSKVAFVTLVTTLVILVALAFTLGLHKRAEIGVRGADALVLTEDSAKKLDLLDGYEIRFASADTLSIDSVKASDIATKLREQGVYVPSLPDAVSAPQDKEILIGTTDRQESASFYQDLLGACKNDDDLVWGYYIVGEKVLFTANITEAFSEGFDSFVAYLENCSFQPTVGTKSVTVMTRAEYDELVNQREEEARQKIIDALIEKNNAFADEKLFNGYKRVFDENRNQVVYGKFVGYEYSPYKSMIGETNAHFKESPYQKPWVYPTEGQHPRYLITSADVERIKEMMNEPEYEALFKQLWYWAEFDIQDGIFPERVGKSGKTYRYQENILAGISARALAYLITGDEIYAYEAIIGIKNVMITIEYTSDIHMDIYHGASHAMTVLAAVYDWCYPVLTDVDKKQMIEGAANGLWPSMEFEYPPLSLNGISGHGTGPQFLRDYLTLAIAFYDEAPDWYELMYGRYFQEYLPVANEQYVNGWISQGTACYAPIKLMVQLWAANLLKVATGENFFIEDAALSVQLFISQIQPNGKYFQTGDGGRNPYGAAPGFAEFFVSAALFNDPVAAVWAKYLSNDYTKYDYGSIFTMTPDLQLAFLSRVKKEKPEDKYEDIGLVQYFLDPAGQMTARDSWDSDGAAVFMKVGNMSMSNHDVYEHGTFQIYYKGLLAADSGSYKHYGGDSHYYYLQCTVAHNGLLIFNPAKAQAAKLGNEIVKCKHPGTFCDHAECETVYDITNPSAYYYSGSQHRLPSPSTLAQWHDGSYRMAETIGADWGYNLDGSTKYAYLAGDITDAYDDVTVDYVARRMLTLYTGREDVPMIFITYDEIESDKDYYEKTFLLHTIKEPVVDAENMTAVITSDEGGVMVLKSLYGAKVMEKIGGEGKAYWINGYFADPNDKGSWDDKTQTFLDPNDKGSWQEGKNCLDEYTLDDNYMNIWGRIQLRTGAASREKTTVMLNAMYVTDAVANGKISVEGFKNDYVYGAKADNNFAVFYTGADKAYKEFNFETEGNGLYNYYISGVADGTWRVSVDGVSVAYALSDNEAGMLSFVAPAGKVVLAPGKDVVGANGGKIQYATGGATMPEDTPYSYNNETVTKLPENPVRGEDLFLGWYLTSEFLPEDRVYEVPFGITGTFKVYAKWLSVFINEDYSNATVSAVQTNGVANGITYAGSGKPESSFKTYKDENGNGYLEWIEGSSDSFIHAQSTSNNISTAVADDMSISYTVQMTPKPGAPIIASSFQIIAKCDVNGMPFANNGSRNTKMFSTTASGDVLLANGDKIGTLKEGEITTVRLVIDFKYGQFIAYDENGDYISSSPFAIPADTGAKNTAELKKCYAQYLFYWHGDSAAEAPDSAIRIYKIKMQDGNVFEGNGGVITEKSIVYEKNGGVMPKGTPYVYSTKTPTFLPVPKRAGYAFCGWYTTEGFEEGTRVAYVPTTNKKAFYVYAKWKQLPVSENFEGDNFDIKESTSGSNGQLSYNAGSAGEPKPGSSFVTVVEKNGNTYLKASVGSVNAIVYHANNELNLTNFPENAISYELDIKKLEGIAFPKMNFIIATSGGAYGQLSVASIDENGNAKLSGSSKVFAVIGEESYSTIRITVDFEASAIIAYDEDGNELDRVNVTSVPKGSGGAPETLLDWMKVAKNYLFYVAFNRSSDAEGTVSSAAIDNIGIGIGNIFVTEEIKGAIINYKTGGGTLPDGAPVIYDSVAGTDISGVIPVREGYVFDGWYSSMLFDNEIDIIGVGEENMVSVYAKWVVRPDTIYYETNGGAINSEYPLYYDKQNGTALPTDLTLDGFVFDGWYLTPDFIGDAVTSVGKDEDAPVKVYAKWKLPPDKLTVELNGGEYSGTLPEKYDPVNGTLLPTDVTREYYTFAGWYYDAEFTLPVVDGIAGIGGAEPITVYAKWTLPNNSVSFVTNGGEFATTPPSEYSTDDGLVLPTDITREGYLFGGWYLDAECRTDRLDYIIFGKSEGIVLYARWFKILTDEDYTGKEFEFTEGQPEKDKIFYNAINTDVVIKTVDINGNTCVRVDVPKSGPNTNAVIRTTDATYNINNMAADSITFRFSWAKIKDLALPEVSVSLQSSSGVGGTGALTLLITDNDGNVKLKDGSVILGTINEETFTTFTVYVDFLAGTVSAIDTDGNVLETVTPKAPTPFTSLHEWQRAKNGLKHHILFMSIGNSYGIDAGIPTGVLVDDIKIVEGSLFTKFETQLPPKNTITYVPNGATLPEGAPDTYDAVNGTDISAIIPEREGYRFLGWFDNEGLEGDEITLVGKDGKFPITLYAGWEIITNTIVYETAGGATADDAPKFYDEENGTLLPTTAMRDGYVFGGWYREEGLVKRVYYVPAGYDRPFAVYAKWLKVIAEENYTSTVVNISGKTDTVGALSYNAQKQDEGVSHVTEDFNGNAYVKTTVSGSKNGVIYHANGSYAIREYSETAVSYIVDFRKIEGENLTHATMRLATPDADGVGSASILSLDGTSGNVKLDGSSKVIATVGEGVYTTLRITVDFKDGMIYAYDGEYNVIDSVALKVPAGQGSALEWQRKVRNYNFYVSINKTGADAASLATDNVKVIEGRAFEKVDVTIPPRNAIEYVTGGGEFTTTPPATYDVENGTALPTDLTLEGYIFDGWYTTETFDEGTRVESVGKDGKMMVTVYAKWKLVTNKIVYRTEGGSVPVNAPKLYDEENGTLLPTTAMRDGYVFGGWYKDDALTKRVYYVPAGYDEPFTVYAKWLRVVAEEDYSSTTVNKPEGTSGGSFAYNAQKVGQGVSLVTTDEEGNTFIKATIGAATNAIIYTYDVNAGLQKFTETAVSYRIDLKKLAGENLVNANLMIQTPGADGVGAADVLKLTGADGSVKLAGSSKVIATVGEEKYETLLITVDFATGMIYAYGEDYSVIDSVALKVPAGQGTALEWQKKIRIYNFYFSFTKNSTYESASVAVDNLMVIDGRAYEKADVTIPPRNSIEYVTGGGEFTTTPPATYDAENGTALPTDIVLDGYDFDGWYTTPTFDEGTRVESVGKDAKTTVTVYAKWKPQTHTIMYEMNGGALSEDAPLRYDDENETVLPTTATKDGYVFAGWYTEVTFENRIYVIPAGDGEPFTVYAKWLRVIAAEDYNGKDFTVQGGNENKGAYAYNASNAGMSHSVVKDAGDNDYLVSTVGSASNAVIYRHNSNDNLMNLTDGAVTYQFDLKKLDGEALSSVSFIMLTPSAAPAGQFDTLRVIGDTGEMVLKGSEGDVKLMKDGVAVTINEDSFTTVILTVDFENACMIAYDKDGTELATAPIAVPKLNGAPAAESLLDWQKNKAGPYSLYMNMTGNGSKLATDNLMIIDGRVF